MFFFSLNQEKTTALWVGNVTSRANQGMDHLFAQKNVFPLSRPNERRLRLGRTPAPRKAQYSCANRLETIDARMSGKGSQTFSFERVLEALHRARGSARECVRHSDDSRHLVRIINEQG